MQLKIVRMPLVPRVAKVDFKEHSEKELLTWWYGELIKGRGSTFQPKVLVCFRVLGPNDELTDQTVYKPIALTEIGQFRIGTIWRNSICQHQIALDVETFQLDFDPGTWRYYSAAERIKQSHQPFIPNDVYQLNDIYRYDQAWLLQFPFSNDLVGLLLPCIEFFSRCFGRSEYVKRILATNRWEVARDELLAPLVAPAQPGTWPINMRKRTVNGDAVFIAHLEYDSYARMQAAAIWSRLEGKQDTLGNDQVFVQIGPWFKGPARLKVKGIWIDKGRRFLGLQIVGCSDPDGVPIFRDRENTNKTGPIPGPVKDGAPWDGVPPRDITSKHQIVNITSSETPDHGTGSAEIEEDDFELLGKARHVVNVTRPTTNTNGVGSRNNHSESEQYSGDETSGTGKGVGYGSFHAKTVMESHGALRDVWDMLKRLELLHPNTVRKVEFLNADGSFSADAEPSLIGFKPFTQEELDSETIKDPKWPLLDTKLGTNRGALVARISTPRGYIHFFEIQRRPKTIKKEGEEERLGEQPFRGLVFSLTRPSDLEGWVELLLDRVRYTRGVLIKIATNCPGLALPFNHVPVAAEKCPQERTIVRAFSLMKIEIPAEPQQVP